MKQFERKDVFSYTSTQLNFNNTCFQSGNIIFQGKPITLDKLFAPTQTNELMEIFRSSLSAQRYINFFIKPKETFILTENTIPQLPQYYVNRLLPNKYVLEESAFKINCRDIFVFDGLERFKLTLLAKPHFTSSSSDQVENVSSRFIHLDYKSDWDIIKQIAKVPVHLIKYNATSNTYSLEESCGESTIFQNSTSSGTTHTISEDEFIRRQEEKSSSPIGIFGTPGSGKTLLLASLAWKYAKRYPDRVIAFIRFTQIEPNIKIVLEPRSKSLRRSMDALDYILFFLTPNLEAHIILRKYIVKGNKFHVFLDGFDEVSPEHINWIIDIIQELALQFKNVGIILTSRQQHRQELESTLRIISYDMIPFNETDQIDFLVHYWSHNQETLSFTRLHNFAQVCIKQISRGIAHNDDAVAGVPLQCFLIAKVYSKQCVKFCSEKFVDHLIPVSLQPTSLSKLYQTFMESWYIESLKWETAQHIVGSSFYDPIQLLFPHYALAGIRAFSFKETIHQIGLEENIKIRYTKLSLKTLFPGLYEDVFGVLGKNDNFFAVLATDKHQTPYFNDKNIFDVQLHRTFAEFVVAEYFLDSLVGPKAGTGNSKITNFFLKNVLKTQPSISGVYKFPFFNIIYFINSRFKNLKNFEPPLALLLHEQENNLYEILMACLYHNFHNLFQFICSTFQNAPEKNRKMFCMILAEKGFHKLVLTAINFSTSALVIECFMFLSKLLDLEMTNLCEVVDEYEMTLLQLAVKRGSYEIVEFLVHFCSLEDQSLLYWCVQNTVKSSEESVNTRIQIVMLLLCKQHDLLKESAQILTAEAKVHAKLLNLLAKLDPNVFSIEKEM